jgi:1-aminocyclopropane-1-carboxylate deaminase/D-cysteine desulfhydrase-like pyridoxal-dependent ACC family enzyme
VHVTASADREQRHALVQQVADDLRATGRRPFVIEVGGSGTLGALGQVRAGLELAAQAAEIDLVIDAVTLATATGGTQAGLLVGLRAAGLASRVEGFVVAGSIAELAATIADLARALGAYIPSTITPGDISLDDGQLAGGYGVRSPDAEAAAQLLATAEGMLVDPIYTAKALAGLVTRVRSGAWDGQRVVFWHAGGLPALFEPLDPGA